MGREQIPKWVVSTYLQEEKQQQWQNFSSADDHFSFMLSLDASWRLFARLCE